MVDSFLKFLSCASCQRRAVAAVKVVENIASAKTCPISGLTGACPFKDGEHGDCKEFVSAKPRNRQEPTKVEKLLHRGSELLISEQYGYAELSFDKGIEQDPSDWRPHYGKVVALRGQGKYFGGYSASRRALEKIPGGNEHLKAIQEQVRLLYKESKKAPAENSSNGTDECPVASAPACPGAVAPSVAPPMPQVWNGRVPGKEEREGRKEMLLSIFREQWARLGKAKDTLAFNQYEPDLKGNLKIKGGHQPMPRPTDISLPPDFRKPVGLLTSLQLADYHCDSPRLLISLYGDIFDVSDRPDKYGKDGPYYYFSGRDITWGLVTGQDTEDMVNQFYDLFKMEEKQISKKLQCVCSWLGFYEVEYGKSVGRLAEFEAEQDLPAPPAQNDEQCVLQ